MLAKKRIQTPPFFFMIVGLLAVIYAVLVDKTVTYVDVGLATIAGASIYKAFSLLGKRLNLSYSFYQEKNYQKFPDTYINNLKVRSLILLDIFHFSVLFENFVAEISSVRILMPIATILSLSYLSYIFVNFLSGYFFLRVNCSPARHRRSAFAAASVAKKLSNPKLTENGFPRVS